MEVLNRWLKLLFDIWNELKVEGEEHADTLWFFTSDLRFIVKKIIREGVRIDVRKVSYEGIQKALVNLLACYCEVLRRSMKAWM